MYTHIIISVSCWFTRVFLVFPCNDYCIRFCGFEPVRSIETPDFPLLNKSFVWLAAMFRTTLQGLSFLINWILVLRKCTTNHLYDTIVSQLYSYCFLNRFHHDTILKVSGLVSHFLLNPFSSPTCFSCIFTASSGAKSKKTACS